MKLSRQIQIALVGGFFVATAMVFGSTTILYAANELPHTFTSGTTISSEQVNENFAELLAQIAELRAQIAPESVSIVGTYDFVGVGGKMAIYDNGNNSYAYTSMESAERGTLTFAGNAVTGTVTVNSTDGGYFTMSINNIIFALNSINYYSLIEGSYSQGSTESSSTTYTVSGSTVIIDGKPIGTLSADGKIILISSFDSAARLTGLSIAIKRP